MHDSYAQPNVVAVASKLNDTNIDRMPKISSPRPLPCGWGCSKSDRFVPIQVAFVRRLTAARTVTIA